LEKQPGEKHAEQPSNLRKFDVDLLKVMSDFPYPTPKGLERSPSWKTATAGTLEKSVPEQIRRCG
jgi:hypothetical protein